MRKTYLMLLHCFILVALSTSIFAQAVDKVENGTPTISREPIKYKTIEFEGTEALLFDNGPLVTAPGQGCNGGDASVLDGTLGHTLYGWSCNQAGGFYMADDFTNTATWNLDSLKFFTYQTNATTMTITGVYVQIWNGNPMQGGTVVWGDRTTNRLNVARLSNMYRSINTDVANCARRIQEVVANCNAVLPAGTYWVEWGITGSSTSGPWCPPITIAGQAITGNAIQWTGAAWAEALNNTSPNGAPFMVFGSTGAPIGPGPATNPNPSNGATGVALTTNLQWSNPTGTTNVEVFFGTSAGNLTSVYSGTAVTSYQPSALNYSTTYYWRINTTDGTGTTTGTIWNFTTVQDPNNPLLFLETFEAATYPPTGWTTQLLGGSTTLYWTRQTTASGYGVGTASTRYAFYNATAGTIQALVTMTFSPLTTTGRVEFDHAYATYTGNENDQLRIDYSTDGGTNWTQVVLLDGGPSGPLATAPPQSGAFTPTATQWASKMYPLPVGTNQIRFVGISAFGNNLWLDNIGVYNFIPVELTSFIASVNDGQVTLDWTTATETNNQGFQVERRSSNSTEFEAIGYVSGKGTTLEPQAYRFVDNVTTAGQYFYRLKQVDFDGTFEYSSEIYVDVNVATDFSISQNFPNPFNPTTRIDYSLPIDANVTIKVFDILGREVATLLNEAVKAGVHHVTFNASNIPSGVYFYNIEAVGSNGQNFSSVKKMTLMK